MDRPVGLLTLQGDYQRHQEAFAALGCPTLGVRRPAELDLVSALVIPGGESTTLTRLVDRVGLREPLCAFARQRPILGTCAGLIMLSSGLDGEKHQDFGVQPLGLLDCRVQRNGYGRQIDSFSARIDIGLLEDSGVLFPGVFIRAPRITEVGPGVEVVARHRDEAVAVRQDLLFGLTFHPELTRDLRLHRVFLDLVVEAARAV